MFISLFISHFAAHSNSFFCSLSSGPFPVSLQLRPKRPAEEPAAGKSMNKVIIYRLFTSNQQIKTPDTSAVLPELLSFFSALCGTFFLQGKQNRW